MNAVVDQDSRATKVVQGAQRASAARCIGTSNRARAHRIAHAVSRRFVRTFLVPFRRGLRCVSESLVSTIIAAILLIFGLAFTALMVLAILVVLTCGLACYA
jgi:hypothetical protein